MKKSDEQFHPFLRDVYKSFANFITGSRGEFNYALINTTRIALDLSLEIQRFHYDVRKHSAKLQLVSLIVLISRCERDVFQFVLLYR